MLFTILSAVSFFMEQRERERASREARKSCPDYRGPLHEMSDIVLKTFEHRTSATDNKYATPNKIEQPEVHVPVAIEPTPKARETPELSESERRRRAWESGNMDYTGADSFDNIMKKLNESMGCTPSYYS